MMCVGELIQFDDQLLFNTQALYLLWVLEKTTAEERWCLDNSWSTVVICPAGAIMIHCQLLNSSLGSNVFVGSIKCFSCRQLFLYVVNCLYLS